MADMTDLINEMRRRNQLQQQQGMGMGQYGAPTMGGGGQPIGPQTTPLQLDYGSAAPQQQQQGGMGDLAKALREYDTRSGGKLSTGMKSMFRNWMGNTGMPGSGSMLGGQTTGTLANAGAQNVGAGMMGPMSPSGISLPGAMGSSGAGAGQSIGSMMGSMGGAQAGAGASGIGAGSVAWPAAAVLALDKLGISPAKETFKGYAPSNIMEKIGIKGSGGGSGALPQMGKGIVQFMGGDFKHGWENTADSVKNIFKLKFF